MTAAVAAARRRDVRDLLRKLAQEPFCYRPWELARLSIDQLALFMKDDPAGGELAAAEAAQVKAAESPSAPTYPGYKGRFYWAYRGRGWAEDRIDALWADRCRDEAFCRRHGG